MAAKTRRSYKGGAASTTISAPLDAAATTFQIVAYTGWPYGSDPFYVVVEPGTANEEKMLVTRSGSTDLTVNVVSGGRGADDTSDLTHNTGSVVYPVFTAVDADEANELASTLTSKGDLLTMDSGPSFNRLAVGTNGLPLLADSAETTGLKWGQIGASAIADGAITSAKFGSGQIVQSYSVQILNTTENVPAASEGTAFRYVDFTPTSASNKVVIVCNFFMSMASLRRPALVVYRGPTSTIPSGQQQPATWTRISYSTSLSPHVDFYTPTGAGVHIDDYDVANMSFTVQDEPNLAETLRYGFTFFNSDSVTRSMKFNYPQTSLTSIGTYPTHPLGLLARSQALFLEISA